MGQRPSSEPIGNDQQEGDGPQVAWWCRLLGRVIGAIGGIGRILKHHFPIPRTDVTRLALTPTPMDGQHLISKAIPDHEKALLLYSRRNNDMLRHNGLNGIDKEGMNNRSTKRAEIQWMGDKSWISKWTTGK